MSKWILVAILTAALGARAADSGEVVYQNDFSKAEVGKLPEDMLVLDGNFAVQEVAGNKVLQLPGAPLDTYGVLFGPSEAANLCVSARIHGTKKGRREPAFAIGLNGNAGYRLQVSASKKLIEIFKGEEGVAKEPFTWPSDSWTMLKLQLRKVKDSEYVVEGKAWSQGGTEPAKWQVTYTDRLESGKEPNAGRPSIWGNPFAGTPIEFDDLVVTTVK